MGRKKKTPEVMINNLCISVNKTIDRWKNHKVYGCNDPCWPDGVNMNLLRSYLRSGKRQIKALCAEFNIPLPPEAYKPDLPYTDQNYFANPNSERAQQIMSRPGWRCYNHETPTNCEYDDTTLTLL